MARRGAFTARAWAWVSTGLAGATTALYIAVIAAEGHNTVGDVLPWVALMLGGTGAVATAAMVGDGPVRRAFALAGAVVLTVVGVLGILSVGIGFLAAAIAGGIVAAAPDAHRGRTLDRSVVAIRSNDHEGRA